MKTTRPTTAIKVEFTDAMRNYVKVTGANTMDEAVTAADSFLDEYGLCVKNGGNLYGDQTDAEEVQVFNVG